MQDEKDINAKLEEMEKPLPPDTPEGVKLEHARERDDLQVRLGEIQKNLIDMEAETGPARAGALLAGLGFSEEDQQKPTRAFSGGWRMRLALARALFVKPDLLMLDEPSNMLDLNAIAWLEDYLQSWPGTILVVSHDRAFLDAVATDIVHQHSQRLDYYKGNFTNFYATKTERALAQRKEYEAQLAYRQHLQAYIDRWRYNAARAQQAQSRIKILEKLPELEPPEDDDEAEKFRFPEPEKISPPILQLDEVSFGYSPDKMILKNVNIDVAMDSRMAIIGPNGAGKSTLIKLLTGVIQPTKGTATINSRVRIAYFTQHHVDQLDLNMTSVQFLQKTHPGKTEQEYRSHLGQFGITGLTGLQRIGTLSGGQKSRVAFAVLSLQHPHILLLDEPTNHLDAEGLDGLAEAVRNFRGGVIEISHDERRVSGEKMALLTFSGSLTRPQTSSGCVRRVHLRSSRATSRSTRTSSSTSSARRPSPNCAITRVWVYLRGRTSEEIDERGSKSRLEVEVADVFFHHAKCHNQPFATGADQVPRIRCFAHHPYSFGCMHAKGALQSPPRRADCAAAPSKPANTEVT